MENEINKTQITTKKSVITAIKLLVILGSKESLRIKFSITLW